MILKIMLIIFIVIIVKIKIDNNVNVIALSGKVTKERAMKMINKFIESKPKKDSKYKRRIV